MELVRSVSYYLALTLFLCIQIPNQGWCADISAEGKIVKEIRISGLHRTREYIVRRELVSKIDEPYRESNIREDNRRLDRLGIFSSIEIYPAVEHDGVIINIIVKETFPYLPTINMQISDENGFSMGAGFMSVNLFGRAMFFSALAMGGGATTVEFHAEDRWIIGHRLGYKFDAFLRDRQNESFEYHENSEEFIFEVNQYLWGKGRIGTRFSYISMRSDEDDITLSESNQDNVWAGGIFVGYDNLNFPTWPTRGWWFEMAVSKSGLFGSDSDFLRMMLDIRRYQPIKDNHSFELYVLGSSTTGEIEEDFAVWQSYTLGGTNSVRGWELASRVGKNQFLGTIEYRYLLMEPEAFNIKGFNLHFGLALAAFFDIGSAWDKTDEFADNRIEGYGLGVRFLVPFVRVIRFDLGYSDSGAGILFHVGAPEKPERQRDRVR
jgi:outer membrane protein assembly factor BamA